MIRENPVLNENCNITHRPRICWPAIISGAFVGVGLGFLLHLFGLAIGLSAYSSSTAGATTIAIGGFIGLLIGVIVSMGAAGFVAGYLGRFHGCHCHGGVIYGFVTWSLALLLSAVFVIPLTNYISLYARSLNPSVEANQPVNQMLGIRTANTNNMNSTAASTPAKNEGAANNQATTETKKETLVWGSWILFILFFVGAVSSCIGACSGLHCMRKNEVDQSEISR